MYGAQHTKETELRGNAELCPRHTVCQHPKRWWRQPPSGKWHYGSHPPLRGKILAVPAEEWTDALFSLRETPDMEFLTRATAAYPWGFNVALAESLVRAALDGRRAASAQDAARTAVKRSRSPTRGPRGNSLVRAGR